MSKEKMISFNGDMVRAILDGSKTMTRRPVRALPQGWHTDGEHGRITSAHRHKGKYGLFIRNTTEPEFPQFDIIPASLQPGDIMCVRERARLLSHDIETGYALFGYEAGGQKELDSIPKRIKYIQMGHCVPNGCFKELVRIKRKVVRVWYEQIQSISVKDCVAEGVSYIIKPGEADTLEGQFFRLWSDCYPGSWDRNDWVECIEFAKFEK